MLVRTRPVLAPKAVGADASPEQWSKAAVPLHSKFIAAVLTRAKS